MSKYFDIIKSLPIKDKVELLKDLYRDIAGRGIGGDTELAHINSFEAAVLRALGGAGTLHEETGLTQYMGGGSPPPAPSGSQTVTQQATIPEELKPYITDILSKSKALQEQRMAEGYQPYQGQQIAGFTPEQQAAFQGIAGLVGTGAQYFDPAARLGAASAQTTTPGMVGQYMSPYMQNVVNIQQREAERAGDVERQRLGAQAVGAGGFGGSRQAILEAEQARNLQQQLGDIQARGVAAAYEDAQRRIAEQRARELGAGQFFGQMGQYVPQTALGEYGALAGVGAQRQAQKQSALDIARSQFEAEKMFPEQQLQQYSSIVRGFPLPASSTQYSTYTQPSPSLMTQLTGAGLTGLGIAGGFGAFKKKGGKVGDGKGLASIVVKRAEGDLVAPSSEEQSETLKEPPSFNVKEKPPVPTMGKSVGPSTIKGEPTNKPQLLQPTSEEDTTSDAMQLGRGSLASQIAQSAQAITEQKPEAAPLVNEFIKPLEEITKKQKEGLEARAAGLDKAKWMAVAEAGLNILSQPGGQTFLQALGKGATASGLTGKLSALSDKQLELTGNLADLDEKTLMREFGFKQADRAAFNESQKLEILRGELNVHRARATTAAEKADIDQKIKVVEMQLKERELGIKGERQATYAKDVASKIASRGDGGIKGRAPGQITKQSAESIGGIFDNYIEEAAKAGAIPTNWFGNVSSEIKSRKPLFIQEYNRISSTNPKLSAGEVARQAIQNTFGGPASSTRGGGGGSAIPSYSAEDEEE